MSDVHDPRRPGWRKAWKRRDAAKYPPKRDYIAQQTTELDRLIAEQRRDDTHYVRQRDISLQTILNRDSGLMLGDLIGIAEGGELVNFARICNEPVPWDDIPHGTPGGYTNWKCRCSRCTAANAAAQERYWARRRKGFGLQLEASA